MDKRDGAKLRRWWTSISDCGRYARTTLAIEDEDGYGEEDLDVAIRWVVCETCEGRGSYVNPSVDAHGIGAEESAEDPEFAAAYLRGTYDVPCEECGGRRVVPVPIDDDVRARVEAEIEGRFEIERMYEAERRFGA